MVPRISTNLSALLEPVVYDAPDECPYLPGRTSRLPLRYPLAKLSPAQFDQRLAQGDRRSGLYLYRPACPGCRACESLRIDVHRFQPNATQRRTLRRGDRLLEKRIAPPTVDAERVALFNKHRRGRDLAQRERDIDPEGYESFLVDSCCETTEISYWLEGRLVGVAIADRGAEALSAVYCYFDPDLGRLSLGVYNVLQHVELCRIWNGRYVYLGFYVAGSEHMAYKALYLPHERFIDGRWRTFDREPPPDQPALDA